MITIFQRVLIFEQSVNHRRGPRSWPQIGGCDVAFGEKIDLRTDDEDVAKPDWVLQPVAIGPAAARTADIGTGGMASALKRGGS